ncbi:exported hypothetical protein [Candidatus Nitrotoga sp. HW29]|uniref:hypothetical protein n=1 Tax=Candidatus Nitrotoga sp. HW29 TaxID=2886963 RepID=UPI001EF234C2|nr:hypothetical protein [Candidatus Nitrotoga sp. HW29]CAH1904480.1 exported hypothetical protein [Candidatus Nitrotoga sp. HW29]
MKKILVLALAVTIATSPVLAYDIPNHFDMSREAAQRSVLQTDSNVLLNLGFSSLDIAGQKFLATEGENSTDFTDECKHMLLFPIDVLIGCGAQFEDVPGTRSLNHFYDPINNSPLKVRIPPIFGPLVAMGSTSPDWGVRR